MWTQFWDMNSGGDQKEKWAQIYIEASKKIAIIVFYNRFGHNPYRVTCTCCGEDYSISEEETLKQSSACHRGCRYAYFDKNDKEISQEEVWEFGKGFIDECCGKYVEEEEDEKVSFNPFQTVDEYKKDANVLIITESEIKPEEKIGEVPQQGYVWID